MTPSLEDQSHWTLIRYPSNDPPLPKLQTAGLHITAQCRELLTAIFFTERQRYQGTIRERVCGHLPLVLARPGYCTVRHCVCGECTQRTRAVPPPPPEYGGLGLVAGMRLLTVVSCHGLCVRTPVLSTTPPFF